MFEWNRFAIIIYSSYNCRYLCVLRNGEHQTHSHMCTLIFYLYCLNFGVNSFGNHFYCTILVSCWASPYIFIMWVSCVLSDNRSTLHCCWASMSIISQGRHGLATCTKITYQASFVLDYWYLMKCDYFFSILYVSIVYSFSYWGINTFLAQHVSYLAGMYPRRFVYLIRWISLQYSNDAFDYNKGVYLNLYYMFVPKQFCFST